MCMNSEHSLNVNMSVCVCVFVRSCAHHYYDAMYRRMEAYFLVARFN